MRTIAIGTVALVASVSSASAADMYAPYEPELRSSYDWSGNYVGVHGGYGWGKSRGSGSSGASGLGVLGGGGFLDGLLSGTGDFLGDFDAGILSDLIDSVLGDADLGGLGDLIDDLLGGGGLDPTFDELSEILAGIEDELAGVDFDLGLRGESLDEFEGFLGGVQIGRNWQSGPLVAGVEADFSLSDMNSSESFAGSDSVVGLDVGGLGEIIIDATVAVEGEVENELNWLGTLRGRFGVAENRFLIFGTGGVAFGDMRVAANLTTSIEAEVEVVGEGTEIISEITTVSGVGDDIMIGYTVGAGIEFAINDQWTTRVEYAYINLGMLDVHFDDGTTSEVEVDMHLVKAGANYRF